MLLSAASPQTLFSSNPNFLNCLSNNTSNAPTNPNPKSLKLVNVPPSSLSTATTGGGLRHVSHTLRDGESDADGVDEVMVASAAALASAIRGASTSPVDFVQVIEKDRHNTKLVMPSADFQRLCIEQLDLFRQIVDPNAILSVYVRPAGSYVMDRLELRRVACYPGAKANEVVVLIGNFSIPAGLRAAESALSSQKVEVVSNHRAVVFPLVKHPFVVGFLVAELPEGKNKATESLHYPSPEEAYALPPSTGTKKSPEFQFPSVMVFTAEQRSYAVNISRTLALAYVMDQKAMLLQQSSWQNNVRMSKLVEQIRGPLSSIQTLSKMLSIHTKRSEISFDIVEDILEQGDRMRDTLQELQDAVFMTKANIIRYNEGTLKKLNNGQREPKRSQLSDNSSTEDSTDSLTKSHERFSLDSGISDLEMPMPPLALAPLGQHGIRPCNVSEVLIDLVEAIKPLALQQQRAVRLSKASQSTEVAVEEPALRQALSNLIEGALLRTHVGGKVEISSCEAPAGGALVVIDDDGPDMHYMTQMHSLSPFGAELQSGNMEDNMTWNFVAGLTVAREILESYGCVVRVISPRSRDTALGAGGTHIELWLPSFITEPNSHIGNNTPQA